MPLMKLILDMEADDLVFSDDAFPALPKFPCLSSPSAPPSPSVVAPSTPSIASLISSSSSSPCAFLNVPVSAGVMQSPASLDAIAPAAGPESCNPFHAVDKEDSFDILVGMDLFPDSLEPSSFLPDDRAAAAVDRKQPAEEEAGMFGSQRGDGGSIPSEDLAKVFLDWLKKNEDWVSLEDLRGIKLKRSTIECATRRLGGGKQGRVQLLKLILFWVQNHHLLKRRHRINGTGGGRCANSQFPNHPLPSNNVEFSNYKTAAASWTPYAADSSFPAMMPVSGSDSVAVTPYNLYRGSSSCGLVVNSLPFSPVVAAPEFHAAEQVAPAASSMHYPHFTGGLSSPQVHAGNSAGCQKMDSPGLGIRSGIASATKEARKNRMARHRRPSMSLNRHRSQQNQQPPPPASSSVPRKSLHLSSSSPDQSVRALSGGGSGSSDATAQPSGAPTLPPLSDATVAPPPALQLRASPGDRPQREKNLKFLLQKVLKQSDLGSLGRIVLPKEVTHLSITLP
ncbi:B3 domain-containing protein VP1 [Apostasia shenzhenica]|uniref:B3 domain-containing protein VP1 n=1 Tax=Apostasia shenzhenica TaxID=1088818 RepID=A0A2I0AGK0_9ASPA|nr:B3 domain-containing protein VP1 [Apostasia shenzhenica]